MNPCGKMYVSINTIPTMKFDSKAVEYFGFGGKYIFSISIRYYINLSIVLMPNSCLLPIRTQNVLSIIHEVLLLEHSNEFGFSFFNYGVIKVSLIP